MTNNFQINTVYSDLPSKVHYQSNNGLWKVSLNIQHLFGNYLSSLPIDKKCISFYLFCLLLNCMLELIFSEQNIWSTIISKSHGLRKYWTTWYQGGTRSKSFWISRTIKFIKIGNGFLCIKNFAWDSKRLLHSREGF